MRNKITLTTKRQRTQIAGSDHSCKLIRRATGRRGPRSRQTLSSRKHITMIASYIEMMTGSRFRLGRRNRPRENNSALSRDESIVDSHLHRPQCDVAGTPPHRAASQHRTEQREDGTEWNRSIQFCPQFPSALGSILAYCWGIHF